MTEQYSYERVAVTQVSEALTKIFASMQGGEGEREYSRSANRNLIMVLFGREILSDVDALIDSLALVHPSRFFIVVVDDSSNELNVEIGARCVGLSKLEHACSEIIRISVPRKNLHAVPSVIRAHMMSGMTSELFLIDSRMTVDALNLMSPQTDMILYDSGEFDSRTDLLSKVVDVTNSIVDLQWLALSPWRDEIKRVFDSKRAQAKLANIQAIEISAQVKEGRSEVPSCALILAGWFIEKLGLKFSPVRNGQVTCRLPSGRELPLRIKTSASPVESKLTGVLLSFEKGEEVSFTRKDKQIETLVKLGDNLQYSTARSIEDESRGGRLRKYFLIGESTTNYNGALRTALKVRGSR